MTDRELLELAAKAAGYSFTHALSAHAAGKRPRPWIVSRGRWRNWNPLTDDGDALRLAVALMINIWMEKTLTITEVCIDSEAPNMIKKEYCDAETQLAATRRAIVRAAAEIGKGME